MNVTRLAGWLLVLFAAVYLLITLMDFGPEYAAAGNIGANADKYGLQTSETNLRFKLGLEFAVDVLLIGTLAIAGWWLTTSEVVQIAWIIIIGIFGIFSVVIRSSPVMPLNVLKLSPGAAFYGAKVQVPIGADITYDQQGARQYVVITKKQEIRVAQSMTAAGQASDVVVLDLSNKAAGQQYMQCGVPFTIIGKISGTGSYCKGNQLWTAPLIKVESAKTGMPEKK